MNNNQISYSFSCTFSSQSERSFCSLSHYENTVLYLEICISFYKPLHVKISEYRNFIFFDYLSRTELQNFSRTKIDQMTVITSFANTAAHTVLKQCKKEK